MTQSKYKLQSKLQDARIGGCRGNSPKTRTDYRRRWLSKIHVIGHVEEFGAKLKRPPPRFAQQKILEQTHVQGPSSRSPHRIDAEVAKCSGSIQGERRSVEPLLDLGSSGAGCQARCAHKIGRVQGLPAERIVNAAADCERKAGLHLQYPTEFPSAQCVFEQARLLEFRQVP